MTDQEMPERIVTVPVDVPWAGRRIWRKALVVGVALCLGAGAAVAVAHGPDGHPPPKAHVPHGVPTTVELRAVATVDLPNPTNAVVTGASLWVVGGDTRTLAEVDPVRNRVIRQVLLPHSADSVAATPGADSLWVASASDDLVMRINRASLTVAQTLHSTASASLDHPVDVMAVGDAIWVTNFGSKPSTALELDARSGAVIRVLTLPGTRATGPVLEEIDQPYLWFLLGSNSAVVRVAARTGHIDGPVGPGGPPTCGHLQAAYGRVIWSSGEDPSCQIPTQEINWEGAPTYGPVHVLDSLVGAGGQVWASDRGNDIYRIDLDTRATIETVSLDEPSTLNRLVTADDAVWVLRGRTNQLIKLEPFVVPR